MIQEIDSALTALLLSITAPAAQAQRPSSVNTQMCRPVATISAIR